MLAQCPQCSTVFRLPLSLLEAAEGRVRCGQCGAVFDAAGDLPSDLQKLLSRSSADAGPDVLLSPAPDDEAVPEFHLLEDELEDVLVEAAPSFVKEERTSQTHRAMDSTPDSMADTAENEALSVEVVTLTEMTRVQEDITLEGQKVSIFNEETGEYRTFAAETPADPLPETLWEPEEAAGENVGDADAEEPPPVDFAALAGARGTPPENRRRWPWWAASALLGVVLAAQLVHFNRDRLALAPAIGPALIGLYSRFDLPLSPAWDLGAYRVRQWGANAEANGALRIRASVFNTANRPQPYPFLRLTLQDRFGEPLGLRDLQPRDYLPSSSGPSSSGRSDSNAATGGLLAPGQRIDADILLVDPGKNAIGFELDACLRDEHTFVRCANDLRRKVK